MSSRGAQIRDRRLALGLDLRPLAKAAGVDRATLSRVELDLPKVRETTYARVERALDEIERADQAPQNPQRQMTDEEVAALVTLIRGGWLRLELTTPPEAP